MSMSMSMSVSMSVSMGMSVSVNVRVRDRVWMSVSMSMSVSVSMSVIVRMWHVQVELYAAFCLFDVNGSGQIDINVPSSTIQPMTDLIRTDLADASSS